MPAESCARHQRTGNRGHMRRPVEHTTKPQRNPSLRSDGTRNDLLAHESAASLIGKRGGHPASSERSRIRPSYPGQSLIRKCREQTQNRLLCMHTVAHDAAARCGTESRMAMIDGCVVHCNTHMNNKRTRCEKRHASDVRNIPSQQQQNEQEQLQQSLKPCAPCFGPKSDRPNVGPAMGASYNQRVKTKKGPEHASLIRSASAVEAPRRRWRGSEAPGTSVLDGGAWSGTLSPEGKPSPCRSIESDNRSGCCS